MTRNTIIYDSYFILLQWLLKNEIICWPRHLLFGTSYSKRLEISEALLRLYRCRCSWSSTFWNRDLFGKRLTRYSAWHSFLHLQTQNINICLAPHGARAQFLFSASSSSTWFDYLKKQRDRKLRRQTKRQRQREKDKYKERQKETKTSENVCPICRWCFNMMNLLSKKSPMLAKFDALVYQLHPISHNTG